MAAGTALASPEFDELLEVEVASWNEDTHAVTVIGKMLVGILLLLAAGIMLAVAFWTRNNGGTAAELHASHAAHAEEADE